MKRLGMLALLSITACDAPLGLESDAAALLVTDANEYPVSRGQSGFSVGIRYVYSNRTDRVVELSNCNGFVGPSLEKLDSGSWVPAWSPIEALCLTAPVRIAVGAQYRDSLQVVAFDPGQNAGPEFLLDGVDGTYRLIWHRARWGSEEAGATSMPVRLRVSNSFRLLDR